MVWWRTPLRPDQNLVSSGVLLALVGMMVGAAADVPYDLVQDDAGSGRDAPGTFEKGLRIAPGHYTGSFVDVVGVVGGDTQDWYRVWLEEGERLTAHVEPVEQSPVLRGPSLWLAEPDGAMAGIENVGSMPSLVGHRAGWFAVLVMGLFSGAGDYALDIWVEPANGTTFTRTGPGYLDLPLTVHEGGTADVSLNSGVLTDGLSLQLGVNVLRYEADEGWDWHRGLSAGGHYFGWAKLQHGEVQARVVIPPSTPEQAFAFESMAAIHQTYSLEPGLYRLVTWSNQDRAFAQVHVQSNGATIGEPEISGPEGLVIHSVDEASGDGLTIWGHEWYGQRVLDFTIPEGTFFGSVLCPVEGDCTLEMPDGSTRDFHLWEKLIAGPGDYRLHVPAGEGRVMDLVEGYVLNF